MTSIEQSICEAISTIVDKSISEAGYDKTIQGKIVGTVDSTIGSYRVSYQDSTFLAYSTNTDVTYTTGSTVYVLIPSGDFSKDKTILGTVKKLGINYVTTLEGKNAYYINGINVLSSSISSFEMSSWYPNTYTKVLYSKDNTEKDNIINIDTTAVEQYIKTSSNIICGASVRTALATEQQYNGDYGIIFALDFLDNTGNEIVTRYYIVDVDKMTGNPYKLLTATDQYGIFDIDYSNFIEINYISLFCYGFPNSSINEADWVNDIFISDIYFYGATALSDDEANGYALTFTTPRGTYFTSSSLDSDELIIQANVRVKGSIIDPDSQSLSYYWFSEHAGITSQSFEYNKYGGQGWKCLNDYNKIAVTNYDNEGTEVISYVAEWVPGDYELVLKKSEVAAANVTYKCVVIYDGTTISNTIIIKNLGSDYDVTIESDSGTQFYYDIGSPTLTCLINGKSSTSSNYIYSWSVTDSSGSYSSIAETADIDKEYNTILQEYEKLLSEIESGTTWAAAVQDELSSLEVQLASYDDIQRVEGNTIYNLDVSSIVNFSKYTCTVYYGELYIGTASITIVNSLTTEGTYTLVINNGTYAYKYNENGISPASNSVDSPIDIPALSFTVYDNNGEDITDTCYSYVRWEVPASNTMLAVNNAYDSYIISADSDDPIVYQQGDESTAYTLSNLGLQNFVYSIAGSYNASYSNNDIKLSVYLRNQALLLEAITNLTFTKEGESGTNGTEYTCKIVPNVSSGSIPKNVIVTQTTSGSYSLNFTPRNSNRWFRAQLYHNETLILDSTTSATTDEGSTATIEWSILKNQYTSSVSDTSSLSVVSSTGVFSYNGYLTTHPANIVKVTITYGGVVYYATYPVITVKLSNNNYKAILKDGTGFKYATYTSDGLTPKYDNSNPFTILMTQTSGNVIDGDATEKNASGHTAIYTWNYLGRIYEKAWITESYLEENTSYSGELSDNQLAVKPKKSFDGQCVTNALQCVIEYNNTEIARIHIPIHLLLNKYGLASLNGWDGNSVEIDSDGGFILAPQIGAGIKENDNSFTGIVMGSVKESGSSETEVGLFGYSSGLRSIFLDAYTGKAEFGTSASGKIVIDPTDGTLQIYSSDYVSGKSGLLIDLSTPQIVYGNGNFSVDENGYITAKGGGTIAGFSIDDDSLWTSTKSSSTNVRISSVNFSRTVNRQSDSTMRMAFSNNFGVNSDGKMYAASGIIGSGTNKITLDQSSVNSSYSAIYSGNKSYLSSTAAGFYIGTDGIAVGSKFSVDSNGNLQAANATITGGSLTIGSNFEVTSSGNLTAKNANFSGDITASSITGSTIEIGALYVDEEIVKIGDFYVSADGSNTLASKSGYFELDSSGASSPTGDTARLRIGSETDGFYTWIIGGNIVSTGNHICEELYPQASWWDGWSLTQVCESLWDDVSDIKDDIKSLQRQIDRLDDDDDDE